MIISNAVPKGGGHLLFNYLIECGGLKPEPGELYADINVDRKTRRVIRRPVSGSCKDIWAQHDLRHHEDVLADLSLDKAVNAHVHDGISLRGHKVAFVYRNPRNVLVSAARFSAVNFVWLPDTEEPSVAQVRSGMGKHVWTTIARCNTFYGWVRRANVSVRFEDLINKKSEEAQRVAVTLGLEPKCPSTVLGDAAPWITPEYRGTWSGKLSAWERYWDDNIDMAWRAHGGPNVEKRYGYA